MPHAEPIGNRRLITPTALSLMTGDRPFVVRELVRIAGVRRYWIGGPRLDHAEYARKIGTGPLSLTTGHYGMGSGVIRAAQPCGTIGIAQKKRSDRSSTSDRTGDSRDAWNVPDRGDRHPGKGTCHEF
jgi:hypothetical protein